jgi:hypothetical protein
MSSAAKDSGFSTEQRQPVLASSAKNDEHKPPSALKRAAGIG